MADLDKIQVSDNYYDVKDKLARPLVFNINDGLTINLNGMTVADIAERILQGGYVGLQNNGVLYMGTSATSYYSNNVTFYTLNFETLNASRNIVRYVTSVASTATSWISLPLSSSSRIENEGGNPNRQASLLKNLAQKEWNVQTVRKEAELPTSFSTLSFISLAALLVKVTAKIEDGSTLKTSIKQAIRYVNTRVFPDPAPAMTRTWAEEVETA